VIIQGIVDGGLKMPDMSSMIKAMKLTWLNKLIEKDNNFTNVAKVITRINNFERFCGFKNDAQYLNPNIPNFYRQIFSSWYELYSTLPTSKKDILNEKLWFNKHILVHNEPVIYKQWENNGILKVADIIKADGNFKTLYELETEFDGRIDVMMYNSLKSAIPKPWLKELKKEGHPGNIANKLVLKIRNIGTEITGLKCRDFYWEYVSKMAIKPTCIDKWEEYYYYVNFDWKYIFTLPYLVARETKLQSLQYQILNRYIPCKSFLKLCGKEESDKCDHCNNVDNIEHFFFNCIMVMPFWESFDHWFSGVFQTRIQLHTPDILFGITNDNNDIVLDNLNFCILFAKSYIYDAKKSNKEMIFNLFLLQLKKRLDMEKFISEMQNKTEYYINFCIIIIYFETRWQELYGSFRIHKMLL